MSWNGISETAAAFVHEREQRLSAHFADVDRVAEENEARILAAFQKHRVEESCFHSSTGYGYNDLGREKLEAIYADVFGTEDAIVRPQLICGTHALTVALFGVLRPGDELLYVTGEPYDTLLGVIGVRPESGSLKEFGISYRYVPLDAAGKPDLGAIAAAITPQTRMIGIQRSKGYTTRPSLTVEEIEAVIQTVKGVRSDLVVMVDNCYGEFVQTKEPSHVGADLCVGSLIKNPGGGLAAIGGYIVGKTEYVRMCANRMSSPGLGKEQGPMLGQNRSFFQGLFGAPGVVAAAVKTAMLCASVFADCGMDVAPKAEDVRADIVQTITFHEPQALKGFIEGVQAASPVDSFVTPVPWEMPGYGCDVMMAAGNFISGSTIEFSADAPMREPYTAFVQGALNFEHGKLGVMMALEKSGLVP